jgi:hypothetical protein
VFPGLSDAVVRIFITLPRFGIPSFHGFGMNLLILGEGGYQLGSCFLKLVHNDSKRIMLSFHQSRQNYSDCVAGKGSPIGKIMYGYDVIQSNRLLDRLD